MSWHYLNRTMCDILEEMRTCNKTRNYAPMLSLIEEVQMVANRMEAGLDSKRSYYELEDEVKKLRKIRDKLKEETDGDKEDS